MNTHKNANKQGEKILLGGVAAAALGLINAKPQTVKAANQNGNRATKKAASRAVKTKLTYQNETDTETEGETATNDDPAGQNSGSQTAGSENNAGTASSNPAGGSNQDAAAGNTSAPSTTDNTKTEKLGKAVKRDNENPTVLTGVWLGVDVTYQPGLGIFTVKGNNQTINTVNDRSTSILKAKKSRDLLADPLIVDRNQVREVRFEGSLTINGTVQSMFDTLPNLTTVTGLENLNTSNVYSMYGMFANCSSLRSVEGINKLDASKVTDMSYMFENCFENSKDLINLDLSGLNIGLNINKNDTITMKEMFRGCSKLKSIILPDKIDTSQVTDMTGMFYGCSNLVSVSYPSSDNSEDPASQKVDLTKFNTNSLQYMAYMFSKCSNIKDLDLSSFDTGNVTLMDNAFSECRNLTALNIANFNMARVEHYVSLSNLLNKLPKLNKLVLGKNCKFTSEDKTAGLDTPGTWVNVGNGNERDPEMSKKWSSTDLMNNYNGETDHDTYIRFYDGYPVKIHYVYLDKEGKRQPILDKDGKSYDYAIAGNKGDTSSIEPKNIYGYTISKTSKDKVTVTFTDHEQDVYFIYERKQGNPIKVNYLYYVDDKGNTKPLLDKDNKPMTENVDGVLYGDQKDIIPKPVPGYTIKQIIIDGVKQPGTDKATVGYSEKEQNVDFIYTKNPVNNENKVKAADVTVHYKDEFGNTIAPDEILSGYVGDGYTTGAKNISGYTLKTRPDNATGFFSTFPQDVTYIYTKIGTNNTPNINEPNTPTKIPKQNKKRKEKKNPTKQTASRNLSKKQGISSVAKSKKAAALPQTGTNKHSSLALLALGSLTLVGALGAAWFSRKKIK